MEVTADPAWVSNNLRCTFGWDSHSTITELSELSERQKKQNLPELRCLFFPSSYECTLFMNSFFVFNKMPHVNDRVNRKCNKAVATAVQRGN